MKPPKKLSPFRNPMGTEMSTLKWAQAHKDYYFEPEDEEPQELDFDPQ